jgi:phenylacetic acid degradation operon negative regulatory protein
MAVALNECFAVDPLLPPELLPRPWPGRSARDLVVRSRRLAVASLQSHTRPTLFRMFDDAIDAVR